MILTNIARILVLQLSRLLPHLFFVLMHLLVFVCVIVPPWLLAA